jgi:hypothetical protein
VSWCFSSPDSGFLNQSWTYRDDVVAAYNRCVFTRFDDEVHVLVVPRQDPLVDLAALQIDRHVAADGGFQQVQRPVPVLAHTHTARRRLFKRTVSGL